MKINSLSTSYNQNKPSFKSRIEFISWKNFREIFDNSNDLTEVEHFLPGDFNRISGNGKIGTQAIASCTSYAITSHNFKKALMEHCNKYTQDIHKAIDRFVNNGRGLVVGGNLYDMDIFFKKSIEAFRGKLPTSIFWGQRRGYANTIYDLGKDTWYINKVCDGQDVVSSASDLKHAFDIIHIDSGDTVYINGKEIDSKLLNQNDEAFRWS